MQLNTYETGRMLFEENVTLKRKWFWTSGISHRIYTLFQNTKTSNSKKNTFLTVKSSNRAVLCINFLNMLYYNDVQADNVVYIFQSKIYLLTAATMHLWTEHVVPHLNASTRSTYMPCVCWCCSSVDIWVKILFEMITTSSIVFFWKC